MNAKTGTPFAEDGAVVSFFLHCAVAFVILVAPGARREIRIRPLEDTPIIIDLKDVEIRARTNLPTANPAASAPAPAPAPIPVPAKAEAQKTEAPEPVPAPEPIPTRAPEPAAEEVIESFAKEPPAPTPEELAARAAAARRDEEVYERLMRNDEATRAATPEFKAYRRGIEATDSAQPSSGAPLGGRFSVSYLDAVRAKLRSCWNIDPGLKGIRDMKIAIRAGMTPDGGIVSAEILDQRQYDSSTWYRAAADAARRALFVCAPYSNLPAEFYDEWKVITFVFWPGQGIVQ